MWFVYASPSFPGNALFEATSEDGEHFQVSPRPLVTGAIHGARSLHYPQVVGDALWFTLADPANSSYGVLRAPLAALDNASIVLPVSGVIGPRAMLPRALRAFPGYVRINRWLCLGLAGGREYFGCAHPHVMTDGTMYFHAYHLGPGGAWMDISSCRLGSEGPREQRLALSPATSPHSWDAQFVADPFVLVL
jgi:hypothetical protein